MAVTIGREDQRPAYLRKSTFRAAAGISLEDQKQLIQNVHASGNDMLKKLNQMKAKSSVRKKKTRQHTEQFLWIKEACQLKTREEKWTKDIHSSILSLMNEETKHQLGRKKKEDPEALEALPMMNIIIEQEEEEPEDLLRVFESILELQVQHRVSHQTQKRAFQGQIRLLRQILAQDHDREEFRALLSESFLGHFELEKHLAQEYQSAVSELNVPQVINEQSRSSSLDIKWLDEISRHWTHLSKDDTLAPEVVQWIQSQVLEDCQEFESNQVAHLDIEMKFKASAKALKNFESEHALDRFRYVKISKESREKTATAKETVARLASVYPDIKSNDVLTGYHDQIVEWKRLSRQWKDAQAGHERKLEAFRSKWQAKMKTLVQREIQKQAQARAYQEREEKCAALHVQVHQLHQAQETKRRVEIDEKAEREFERWQLEQAEMEKRKLEIEAKQDQVTQYQQERAFTSLMEQCAEKERTLQEQEARRKLIEDHRDRVKVRQELIEEKQSQLSHDRAAKIRLVVAQERRLESLAQLTPYASRLAEISTDSERLRSDTAAFAQSKTASAEEWQIQEAGLFPRHGYTSETLFRDARFKLGLALREAGLHQTPYAREAIQKVQVQNTSSYRHTIARSTHLW